MSIVLPLLLVDLQRDYFVDDELKRCRDDLVTTCNTLVRAARASGALVVEVRTVHDPSGSTWTITMREDDQGMALKGTDGAKPVEGLETDGAIVVTKTRDSAFFGTDLLAVLRRYAVKHVVLCGLSTESCIFATASDAFANDLAVTLVEDATASVDPALHNHTLSRVQKQYRQRVSLSEQLMASWASDGPVT